MGPYTRYPLPPPRGFGPAHGVEGVVTAIVVVVFVCVLAAVVRCARRDGEWVGPLLMLGALLAVVNDPLVEVAGRCYFATHLAVFHTMGRGMPLWGPFAYSILFGTETFVLYRLARRDALSVGRLRLVVLSTFALDLAIELPVLRTHLYVYYGVQPFKLAGFPLFWVFVNTPAVVVGAAVLTAQRDWFAGARRGLVALVPILAVPTSFYTAGLPVLVAMNSTLPRVLVWAAALLTAAVSMLLMELSGRVLCRPLEVDGTSPYDVRSHSVRHTASTEELVP